MLKCIEKSGDLANFRETWHLCFGYERVHALHRLTYLTLFGGLSKRREFILHLVNLFAIALIQFYACGFDHRISSGVILGNEESNVNYRKGTRGNLSTIYLGS